MSETKQKIFQLILSDFDEKIRIAEKTELIVGIRRLGLALRNDIGDRSVRCLSADRVLYKHHLHEERQSQMNQRKT